MSRPDEELPPLDPPIRFAVQAFRQVKPSPALERRLSSALDAAAEGRAPAKATREPSRGPMPMSRLVLIASVAGLLLASLYGLKVAGHWGASASASPKEVAVQIPDEGHAWVELPATAHIDAHPATVYLDTPASVALNLPSPSGENAKPHTMCTEQRCVHRWSPVASVTHRPTPRVRISEPGRYEFTMTHVSPNVSRRERFVVHAKR